MTFDTTNADRAARAGQALVQFRRITGCDREDALGDLLCDLMHWADAQNFDFALALQRAEGHYAAEAAVCTRLLSVAQEALDYLNDLAIGRDGESEERLAGLRLALADVLAAATEGAA